MKSFTSAYPPAVKSKALELMRGNNIRNTEVKEKLEKLFGHEVKLSTVAHWRHSAGIRAFVRTRKVETYQSQDKQETLACRKLNNLMKLWRAPK